MTAAAQVGLFDAPARRSFDPWLAVRAEPGAVLVAPYRYELWRPLAGRTRGRLLVIGVNPSIATGTIPDPTVNVLCCYGTRLGFSGLDLGNLFGLISTDPRGVREHADPIGPENDERLLVMALRAELVVAAWGNNGTFLDRDRVVAELLSRAGVQLHCLALTKDGHPHHPLRMKLPSWPIPFNVRKDPHDEPLRAQTAEPSATTVGDESDEVRADGAQVEPATHPAFEGPADEPATEGAPAQSPAPADSAVSAEPRGARLDVEDPASIALEIAENLMVAEGCLAELALELLPADAAPWSDRLTMLLGRANRKAEEDLQELRRIHAEVLGCSVEELDAKLAAEKAVEQAEKAERRAAAPPRARKGSRKSGEVPSSAGGSAGLAVEVGQKDDEPAQSPPPAPSALPTKRLDDRQRELLRLIRVEDQLAVYTDPAHIPDWKAIKVVMEALGGRWKTGGKKAPGGFLFPEDVDAREVVRLALETGEILDPKAAGFFETSEVLAAHVVGLARIQPGDRVLEPSAGRGRIARAIRAGHPSARITCCELLPANAQALREQGFKVLEGDFLALKPGVETHDAVCANPPFAARADVHHILWMLRHLRDGGRLVSIASAGVKYRDDELGRAFREELARHGAVIEENPAGSFLESGTGVSTVTISLTKGGPNAC